MDDNNKRAIAWDATDGRCWYCGVALHPFRTFNLDHQIPKSKKGPDNPENLVASCRSCNSSKGSRTLADYRIAVMKKLGRIFTDAQVRFLSENGITVPTDNVIHMFWGEENL